MKRILSLALTFTFLLTMTACGQTQQETPSASESVESSSSVEREASETPSSEPTEESASSPNAEASAAEENLGNFNLETATVTLNSGYEMPIMGLGTYSLSDEECHHSVTAMLEAGGG